MGKQDITTTDTVHLPKKVCHSSSRTDSGFCPSISSLGPGTSNPPLGTRLHPSSFEPLWFPSVTLVSVLLDPSGSCLITVTSSLPSELLTVLVVSKPPSGPLTVLSLTLLLKNLTPPLRPSPWNCSISGPWFPKLKVPLLKPLPPNLSQLLLGPSGSRLPALLKNLTPPLR